MAAASACISFVSGIHCKAASGWWLQVRFVLKSNYEIKCKMGKLSTGMKIEKAAAVVVPKKQPIKRQTRKAVKNGQSNVARNSRGSDDEDNFQVIPADDPHGSLTWNQLKTATIVLEGDCAAADESATKEPLLDSGLNNWAAMLEKMTALSLAVEKCNTQVAELKSSVEQTREDLAKVQTDLDNQAVSHEKADAAATTMMKDIKQSTVTGMEELGSRMNESYDRVEKQLDEIGNGLGNLQKSFAEGEAYVRPSHSGSSSGSVGEDDGDEGPTKLCSADFQGKTYELVLTKTEDLLIRAATCKREVIRRVLLHYHTPVDLQKLTLSGYGADGEARPIVAPWLIQLAIAAINALSKQVKVPDDLPPDHPMHEMARERDAEQERLVRKLTSSILQYYREAMDKQGTRKVRARKPKGSRKRRRAQEEDDEVVFSNDDVE